MTKLVWRADGVPVMEYSLQPGRNSVGRAAVNDVRIDDPSVSARHCELWVHEDSLLVRDLDSTNGTFLDGHPVREAVIGWGQSLRLGGVEFSIANPPARVAIPALPRPADPPPRFLPDGTTHCCHGHPDAPAQLRCTRCNGHWCEHCVRVLRRVGGRTMFFCRGCGGVAVPISPHTTRRPLSTAVYWLDRFVDNFRPRPKYWKGRRCR
jgi:hypothetical protein